MTTSRPTITQPAQTAPAGDRANQGQDSPAAWDRLAAGFDSYVTPSGIGIGDEPLAAIGLGQGDRFLDVAAGSGALSIAAAKRGADVTAIDFSPSMIERLRARTSAAGLTNVSAEVMDGNALDFDQDTFDAAGSQFGVMLFPDIGRGLSELVRVTKPGGHVVIITMGPPSEVEFLTYFVSAMKTAVPDFRGLPTDPPPLPLRLAEPSRLHAALSDAGLSAIDVRRGSYSVEHPSADHLWEWVVSSNPIGAMMAEGATPAQKAVALENLSAKLRARGRTDGPAVLHNVINIGVGRV